MKRFFPAIIAVMLLYSCNFSEYAPVEASKDAWNYESLVGAKGNVFTNTKNGDIPLVYNNATIIYSNTDATTMLIKTEQGKYVYIQGPAVVEFSEINVND